MSVRQPLELQHARVDTLQRDNENLRLELARLTDELSRRGGDCAAGVVVPGGVIVGTGPGAPIERHAGPDAPPTNQADVNVAKANEAKPGPNDAKPNDPKPNDANNKEPGNKGPDEKNVDKSDPKGPDPQHKSPDNKTADKKKDDPKPMVVPPEAKQKQELTFLKGEWRSRTGLATATGEKDLRPDYT